MHSPQGCTVETPHKDSTMHSTQGYTVDSPQRLVHAHPTRMHSVDYPQGLENALAPRPDPCTSRKGAQFGSTLYAVMAIFRSNMTKQELN